MTVLEHEGVLTDRPTDGRILLAAGAAAIGVDLAVRSGVVCLAGTLLVIVVSFGLAGLGHLRNPQARALVAAAPAFGVFLTLRASEWLAFLDVVAVAGLLLAGASFADGGSVLDVRLRGLVARGGHALARLLLPPSALLGALPFGRRRSAPVVRGLALAAPVVVVLAALLASGDAVFAALLGVSLRPSAWMGHVVLWCVGAWGMGGLLSVAASVPPADEGTPPPRLGFVEAAVVLGSLVVLYAGYAITQVVAAARGEQWVLEQAGLTYAEYARSGFFQLLGVAALTLLALAALRACTAPDRRLTALAIAAIGLTLAVVFVAVRRLHLYEQAFGLTVLRLVAVTFAVWVGAVFVLLAASWLGVGRGRSWLPAGAVGVGLALLFALNAVDPEAVVVRRNLARADFDPAYALLLSEDTVPALVARAPEVAAQRCERVDPDRGWAGWNRSVQRARSACADARR